MERLVAASRAIREAVPPELVPVFWVLTAFGSAKLLMLGLSLVYWNWASRRRDLLRVVSFAFLALAVTLLLKYGFDLPRPPESVHRYPVDPSSVGFPSGHAIAASVVYGGAAVTTGAYRDRRVPAVIGGFVALVGLSRVVLGVHYLGDVLAGFAVGAVIVAAIRVRDTDPVAVFAASGALSVAALVVTNVSPDAVLALGGSLGGAGACLWGVSTRRFATRVERGVANALGVAVVLGTIAAVSVVESLVVLALVLDATLVFLIVALPALVARLDLSALAITAD